MRLRLEVTEWGGVMSTNARGWRTWSDGVWCGPYPRNIISEQEFRSTRAFKKWMKEAVESLKAPGTFVLKFKPTGNARILFAGLAHAERGVRAHFVGPREEGYAVAARAARMSFKNRGRDLTREHPAIVAMNEDVWRMRDAADRQAVKDRETRILAEELARQGFTPEKLDAMEPRLRAACTSVLRKRAKDEARRRAEELLLSVLSERQQEDWLKTQTFRVEGSDGVTYRIANFGHFNVRSMTRPAFDYCLGTVDPVPRPDQLVMQKLMLETDAPGFKAVANRMRASNSRVESVNARMGFRESIQEAMDEIALTPPALHL